MYNFQDNEEIRHCRYCGARIKGTPRDYCDKECRIKGQLLWAREQRRRRRWLQNPINRIICELENYNKIHKTNYSYGQFVAYCLPRLIREG